MLDIVWGGQSSPDINRIVGDFVASHIWGDQRHFSEHTSLGIYDEGLLIAGVIFHNYDPHSGTIELSAAATTPKWLSPRVLNAMYSYPFIEIGCQMVLQRNSENNHSLNNILRRFGFTEHRIDRMRGRDEAELIFTLTKEKWLSNGYTRKHHGQIKSTATA